MTFQPIEKSHMFLNLCTSQCVSFFNPSTTIDFQLPERSFVTLKVMNLLGQEIETVVSEVKEADVYKILWHGGGLPSGVYFYKLETAKFQAAKKMLLVK